MKYLYYVIDLMDNYSYGPYPFKEAVRVSTDEIRNSVITKIVIDEDGKEVK